MGNTSYAVSANIQGDISGQVAVANLVIQVAEQHGSTVNLLVQGGQPVFKPLPRPVASLPRPFRGFMDREVELRKAENALQIAEPVLFYAGSGFGKTTLLRHLAFHLPAQRYPDGVLHTSLEKRGVDDLLQLIFDTFFTVDESASPPGLAGAPRASKPTEAQLHHALGQLQAVLLLDDVRLSFDEVTRLLNTMPQCALIFAAPERCIYGEGCCIPVDGLPPGDAAALFEQQLGRPLTPAEQVEFDALYRVMAGSPGQLVIAAGQVQRGRSISDVAGCFAISELDFAQSLLHTLPKTQKVILAVLAAADAPVPHQHLAALVSADDFTEQLGQLLDQHLVQTHSPAYSLPGVLVQPLCATGEPWRPFLQRYLVDWMAKSPPTAAILDAQQLLLAQIAQARGAKRWADVLALGRGMANALMLGRRWQAWASVLGSVLEAARALGDRAAEGWALHELGSRSLCLGESAAARESLNQALIIRQSIGDRAGAAITRHNLNLLIPPAAPPSEPTRGQPPPSQPPQGPPSGGPPGIPATGAAAQAGGAGLGKVLLALLMVAAAAAVGITLWLTRPTRPVIAPPALPVIEMTETPTFTPILTPTLTVTGTQPNTLTPTRTSTPTPTYTASRTPTFTPTITFTRTRRPPTRTFTPTITITDTVPPSITPVPPTVPVLTAVVKWNFNQLCLLSKKTIVMSMEQNIDRPGSDYWSGSTDNPGDPDNSTDVAQYVCRDKCQNDGRCLAYTFRRDIRYCWLKNARPDPQDAPDLVSGIKTCE